MVLIQFGESILTFQGVIRVAKVNVISS